MGRGGITVVKRIPSSGGEKTERKELIEKLHKKELYYRIPNVSVWRVLRKRLHLKAYKLSIVQHHKRSIVCKPLRLTFFVTLSIQ
jgi:hypothetical protein